MTTNATQKQLDKALREINRKFKGNVAFRDARQLSANRIQFTLKVKDSHGLGARRSHTGRRIPAACWHVHGMFFDELFRANPEAFVRARSRKITKEEGNWVDCNIGSMMFPLAFSEACDCNDTGHQTIFSKMVLGADGKLHDVEVQNINLNRVSSDDPIAFMYGQVQGKSGAELPPEDSEEYRELAPEYIRGFKLAKGAK